MSTFLAVMPAIDEWHCREAVQAARPVAGELLVVDNTPEGRLWDEPPDETAVVRPVEGNLGVAASWNVAARRVLEGAADWLIISSHALILGERLADAAGRLIAAGEAEGVAHASFGWHLVAISRGALRVVGLFDENFWPAYFEETDWLYRAGLAGVASPRENGRAWPHVAIEGSDRGHGLLVAERRVQPDWAALEGYYKRKWGGAQGLERYRAPFNEASLDWRDWPDPQSPIGSRLPPVLSTGAREAR